MREFLVLLTPRYLSFQKGRSGESAGNRNAKLVFIAVIGASFWLGAFAIFYRILKYFQSVEGFGDILSYKLLSMVLLTFFTLLIFSSIVTSLAKFYLSRDLILVHSMPLPPAKVFLARFAESTLDSSWMVIVYSLPMFLSYGIVFKAGILFYVTTLLAMLLLCLIGSALSSLCVMIVAVLLPAGRVRSVFIFFGLILFLILILAFRLMRPEQFVNPEAFASVLLYFRSLSTPASPLLPTTWIYDGLRSALTGDIMAGLFHLSLAASFAVSLIYLAYWTAAACYFAGYSKAQTAPEKLFKLHRDNKRGLFPFAKILPPAVRAFAIKELKSFFRDQTQWPQLFLLVALIVVYVYNFSVLPLEKSPIKTIYLQNTISFLNMGLAAFVLTAISARFVFPAVSLEGEAFWIVRASPVSINAFLWMKFFFYLGPLVALSELLIVATNILLHVTTFMMWLSAITMIFMVPGIVALGVGLGAAYPDFKSENPAQVVTSFGGLLFMLLSAGFIGLVIILQAGPVYTFFMSQVRGKTMNFFQWLWLVGSFSLVFILCVLSVAVPMCLGIKNLQER